MCVRAVDSSKKSGNFKINFVSKAIKTLSLVCPYWECVLVSCSQMDWVGFVEPQ